jgi:uncharacterized protein with HEPN domain
VIHLEYAVFIKDEVLMRAVVRSLEIIGEAVKNVPIEINEKYPDVEWRKIAATRDVIIHRYFGIDYETIWDIIINKLPTLKIQIEAIMAAGSDFD